jgi:hypothetical protein
VRRDCCPDRPHCDAGANLGQIAQALERAYSPPWNPAPVDVDRIAREIRENRAVVVALRSKGHVEVAIGLVVRQQLTFFALRDPWYPSVIRSWREVEASALVQDAEAAFFTRRSASA